MQLNKFRKACRESGMKNAGRKNSEKFPGYSIIVYDGKYKDIYRTAFAILDKGEFWFAVLSEDPGEYGQEIKANRVRRAFTHAENAIKDLKEAGINGI